MTYEQAKKTVVLAIECGVQSTMDERSYLAGYIAALNVNRIITQKTANRLWNEYVAELEESNLRYLLENYVVPVTVLHGEVK